MESAGQRDRLLPVVMAADVFIRLCVRQGEDREYAIFLSVCMALCLSSWLSVSLVSLSLSVALSVWPFRLRRYRCLSVSRYVVWFLSVCLFYVYGNLGKTEKRAQPEKKESST